MVYLIVMRTIAWAFIAVGLGLTAHGLARADAACPGLTPANAEEVANIRARLAYAEVQLTSLANVYPKKYLTDDHDAFVANVRRQVDQDKQALAAICGAAQ